MDPVKERELVAGANGTDAAQRRRVPLQGRLDLNE
jgi:hypothetical protein